jgi:multidrug efflux pump subunit AcrB
MQNINLSRWALQHQPLVRYLMAVLLLGGVLSYFQLGQEEDPPFVFRAMVVRAYWPGATSVQMSLQVADKIEKVLQEVPYADKIRSYSKPGETVIFFQVRETAPAKDVPDTWYTVRKKVNDARYTLPQGVIGPFFNDEFGDTFGVVYAFSADGFDYAELKRFVDGVRQEMLRLPDVNKVDLYGVQDEKLFIELSHQRISQLGLTVEQIAHQINAQNAIEAQGVLTLPDQRIFVRVQGQLDSVEALRKLPLHAGKSSILLEDIATVKRGFVDPPVSKLRMQGKEVIGMGVAMSKGGDIIRLGKILEYAEKKITQNLPVGIEMTKVLDQPKAVSSSVSEFVKVLVEAVVIVLAVSFLSLGLHTNPWRIDTRPGLVVGLTIPLVLAVTFFAMKVLGINLHKISLGALIIALGLLVDDAIIAVEMMVRKLEEGFSKLEAATYAYETTAMPMLTGTLITAAGFLPIGLAQSAAGEYTFSIFAVTALALVISWFVAVLFVPYLGYLLLTVKSRVDTDQPHELFDTPFYNGFRQVVRACVRRKWLTISVTLLSFMLGIYGFKFIEQQFFPDSSRTELLVDLKLPEGSSFAASEQQAKRFESWLSQQPEVANYLTFVGEGAPRFYLSIDQQLVQSNLVQFVITPPDLPAREALRKKATAYLEQNFPDVRSRVKLLPNGPPVPYPVQFRVQGPDPRVVRENADKVKDVLRAHPSTLGVNDNWNENIKVMNVMVDQERARALGVNSVLLSRAANTILSGATIAQYREADKLIDVVLRQPLSERDTMTKLADAHVPTENGRYVQMSQVAKPELGFEPGIIWRENRDFAITVQSDVAEGVQGTTVALQLDKQLAALRDALPLGYRIVIAGVAADSGTAQQSIAAKVPLMLFIVMTLLMLQLHSFKRTLLVYLTGPLGLIGASATMLLLNKPFGFVAQLGVIALLGMIIRNSVILVDQIEQDIAQGVSPWTAVVESAVRRCRPIVLTAAAAVLAMIPLSRSLFWGPMAVAIMGGLIVATVLTLLFLPALYAAVFKVRESS